MSNNSDICYSIEIHDQSREYIESFGFFKDNELARKIMLIKPPLTMKKLGPLSDQMNIRSYSSILVDMAINRQDSLN